MTHPSPRHWGPMLPFRFCLLGAAGAVLFACAHPPPPPAPPPAPAKIDGVYRGTSTRYQADSRACPHPGLVTLYVQNNQFSYRWDYATWVDFEHRSGRYDPRPGGSDHSGRQTRRQAPGRRRHQRRLWCALHRDVARFISGTAGRGSPPPPGKWRMPAPCPTKAPPAHTVCSTARCAAAPPWSMPGTCRRSPLRKIHARRGSAAHSAPPVRRS